MTNQECKVRPQIVNVNSGEPVFYHFSIKTSKCSASCSNINDPNAKMCVPYVVKILNVNGILVIANECYKSCDVGEQLDHEYCQYMKKLVDKLIEPSSAEEFTENIDEVKIAEMALFEHGNEYA